MPTDNKKAILTQQDIRIAIAVAISLLICQFAPIQALAACTSAIMCSQDGGKPSWKSMLTRLLGVICGGIAGAIVALIHSLLPNVFIFALLAGLGILLDMILCRVTKMPYIAARVSAISFMLVALMGGANYAVNRFLGTLCGGVIAVAVAAIWIWLGEMVLCRGTTGGAK